MSWDSVVRKFLRHMDQIAIHMDSRWSPNKRKEPTIWYVVDESRQEPGNIGMILSMHDSYEEARVAWAKAILERAGLDGTDGSKRVADAGQQQDFADRGGPERRGS